MPLHTASPPTCSPPAPGRLSFPVPVKVTSGQHQIQFPAQSAQSITPGPHRLILPRPHLISVAFDPWSAHRKRSSSPPTRMHIYHSVVNQLPVKVPSRYFKTEHVQDGTQTCYPAIFRVSAKAVPFWELLQKSSLTLSGRMQTIHQQTLLAALNLGHQPSQHVVSLGPLRRAGRQVGRQACPQGPENCLLAGQDLPTTLISWSLNLHIF